MVDDDSKLRNEAGYTYYAFVSHSHRDAKWATWIQNALERYRLPSSVRKAVRKPLPKRLAPVFRDATDLGSCQLVEGLHRELEASRFLIVICSPDSAKPNAEGKHYVDHEVDYFAGLGRADRIIPVIVSGTPEEAFCPKIRELDLLAIDATKASRARVLNDIAARILGLCPDELHLCEKRGSRIWSSLCDCIGGLFVRLCDRTREDLEGRSLSRDSDLMVCDSKIGIGVVAPASARIGDDVWIQVCGNVNERLQRMIDEACYRDSDNKAKERRRFGICASRGCKISFSLSVRGLIVESNCQEFCWREEPFQVDFIAHVPLDATLGTHAAVIMVSVDGLPVGKYCFVVNVKASGIPNEGTTEVLATTFKNYFISYSRYDFDKVVARVQGMGIADRSIGEHSFWDKMFLRPGDRYENVIYDYIDNKADVFLLFWSKNAASSAWVRKEYMRALKRVERDQLPEIIPVPLESPPPPPPEELSDINFSDAFMLLKQESAGCRLA